MNNDLLEWLIESEEPWTRYRTYIDLLEIPGEAARVQSARAEMIRHPQIQNMIQEANTWPGYAIKRHNDAAHPIYKFSTLADFGLMASDPAMQTGITSIMEHISETGAFQSLINIPKAFGGTNEDLWTWVLCDSPTLLYTLNEFGLGADARVQKASKHLMSLVDENGWRCKSDTALGKFRGPGKKSDPCPIANVYALKALSRMPEKNESAAIKAGIEMLLSHWENRGKDKMYLFGIGSDFCKLKYPFVWYDILHVADTLSRFPITHKDPRFQEMVDVITNRADENGRYTATSMYRAWKGWSFADKKEPSPWLTFLVLRIQKRIAIMEK